MNFVNPILDFATGATPQSSFGIDLGGTNALGGAGSAVPSLGGPQAGPIASSNMPTGELDFSVAQAPGKEFGQVNLDSSSAKSGILSGDYDVMGGDDFDYKAMVSGIAEGMKSNGGSNQSGMNQPLLKPQIGNPNFQQSQAVMLPTGLGNSSAMNAIQGGGMGNIIGGQPTRDQLLSKMMGG